MKVKEEDLRRELLKAINGEDLIINCARRLGIAILIVFLNSCRFILTFQNIPKTDTLFYNLTQALKIHSLIKYLMRK